MKIIVCQTCKGNGLVEDHCLLKEKMIIKAVCPDCDGFGLTDCQRKTDCRKDCQLNE